MASSNASLVNPELSSFYLKYLFELLLFISGGGIEDIAFTVVGLFFIPVRGGKTFAIKGNTGTNANK